MNSIMLSIEFFGFFLPNSAAFTEVTRGEQNKFNQKIVPSRD